MIYTDSSGIPTGQDGLITGPVNGIAEPAPVVDELYDVDSPPMGEVGTSFDYQTPFGGWMDGNVYLPQEEPLLRDYQHMLDTDGTAASLEKMMSQPIVQAPWSIEPAQGDNGEAQFIYDALTALPHQGGPLTTIETLVRQMTSAFVNKRAFFEKVYKINDDNKVVYHKIAYRPPETCELALDARTAEPRGFRQFPLFFPGGVSQSGIAGALPSPDFRAPQSNWLMIPPERAFVYIHGSWRDPLMGWSSMKVPYYVYLAKRKVRWLWYQYLDQTALPKTLVQNQDEIQARNDARKVATLRSRSVLALGADTIVTSYESSGITSQGSEQYQKAVHYLDSEMLNSILLGFMGLTAAASTGRGSYAMEGQMEKWFMKDRQATALDMARQITNEVIGPLIAYNFGIKASVPRFKFGPMNDDDTTNVMDMFAKIIVPGVQVPIEFYDELVSRVSTILNLDPGKVAKEIEINGSPKDPNNLQNMLGAIDNATELVKRAQAIGQPTTAQPAVTPTGVQSTSGNAAPMPTQAIKSPSTGVRAPGSGAGTGVTTNGTIGTRPFGANSVANPARKKNKDYGK